jgi:hypothetical protein
VSDQQPEPTPREDAPRPLSTRLNAAGLWPPGYEGRPGQRPLRRYSALTTIQAIWPGYIKLFTGQVPEEFWTQAEETSEGERVAVVACPCGEEPKVAQNRTAICPGEDCGRVFLLLGEEIRVARFDPAELAAAAQ